MRKIYLAVAAMSVSLLLPAVGSAASTREDLQDRIDSAKTVLDEILNTPDNSILTRIFCSKRRVLR